MLGVGWTYRQWRQILYTDESRFCVQGGTVQNIVYRRPNEHFADEWVEWDIMRGTTVMVWGGISYTGRTELVVINGNLTAVITT